MENNEKMNGNIEADNSFLPDPGNSDDTTIFKKDGTIIRTISTYYSEAEFKLYRMAILLLGAIVIITVIGVIYLAQQKVDTIPESIIVIGSVAIGALAGVLAPSQSKSSTETTTAPTKPTTNGK